MNGWTFIALALVIVVMSIINDSLDDKISKHYHCIKFTEEGCMIKSTGPYYD